MLSSTLTALTGLLLFASPTLALPQSSSFPPINHDTPNFRLRTIAVNGNRSFSDLYISSFHTGAGQNAAVGLWNETQGNEFFLNSTYLNRVSSNPFPWSIGLSPSPPYNSTAPANYNYVNIDAGVNTPGFRLSRNDIVVYTGRDFPFRSFAICFVEGVAPYQSVGPQYQLLWRPRGVRPDETGECADVLLRAEFC